MKIRWNSRLASNLAVVLILITSLFLWWRMSPSITWFPNLETEPLFESDQLPSLQDVIDQPEAANPAESLPFSPEKESPEAMPEPKQASKPEMESAPARSRPNPRDLEAEALYESWARARQLLRQRDLAGAERAYLELTNRWPKHPDLAGELGNVYILLGEKHAAQTSFRRAQSLLRPMGPSLQLDAVTRWLERHP